MTVMIKFNKGNIMGEFLAAIAGLILGLIIGEESAIKRMKKAKVKTGTFKPSERKARRK